MTIVHWSFYERTGINMDKPLQLMALPPEPVLPQIINARDGFKADTFLNCPAFLDYYKNTFVVRSPLDFKLLINHKDKYLQITPQGQEFYNVFMRNRNDPTNPNTPFIFSIMFNYLFVASNECFIEQIQPSFHSDNLNSKLRVIPGKFDISKWYRPLEVAFEVIEGVTTIDIHKGDPLYYVRLTPASGEKVILKHKILTPKEVDVVERCTLIKTVQPKQSLSTLYKLTESFRNRFAPSKCPFNWRNK